MDLEKKAMFVDRVIRRYYHIYLPPKPGLKGVVPFLSFPSDYTIFA